MILTDTGPLVALINRNDPDHVACVNIVKRLPAELLVTTWPCFTEAMYLLFRGSGYPGQRGLWRLRTTGKLNLYDLTPTQVDRTAELMDKYQDRPMDLADASLVVTAEHLRTQQVFTLDSDFHIYRLADGSPLKIIS